MFFLPPCARHTPVCRARMLLLVFSQALNRLSYHSVSKIKKSNKKGPMSLGHRTFKLFTYLGLAERHKRRENGRLLAVSAE